MARGAEVIRYGSSRVRRRAFGQSLVEFAVALPILLFIIAGIVEVGNIFIQRNRAALVARETARFVATGGEDHDALAVSKQTVEQTLPAGQIIAFDPQHLNIYIIHATIKASDNSEIFDDPSDNCATEDDFCETHIYPTQDYFETCDPEDCVEEKLTSGWTPDQIYDRLSQEDVIPYISPDDDDLKFVAAVVQYNTTTVLDLPIFPQTGGGIPLNEMTIMRQETTIAEAAGAPSDGCSAYPIGVGMDALAGLTETQTVEVSYGTALNQFSYLLWNDDDVSGGLGARLEASLGGDQVPVVERGDDDPPEPNSAPLPNTKDDDFGYDDGGDPADTELHREDLVLLNTSPSGGDAESMMKDHVKDERALRIVECSSFAGGKCAVSRFVIVKVIGMPDPEVESYNLLGPLTIKFIREDFSCGIEVETE